MQDEEVVFKCRSDKAELKALKEKVPLLFVGKWTALKLRWFRPCCAHIVHSGLYSTGYCQLIYNPSEIILGRKFWEKVFVKLFAPVCLN
jgi:hypothetical protein